MDNHETNNTTSGIINNDKELTELNSIEQMKNLKITSSKSFSKSNRFIVTDLPNNVTTTEQLCNLSCSSQISPSPSPNDTNRSIHSRITFHTSNNIRESSRVGKTEKKGRFTITELEPTDELQDDTTKNILDKHDMDKKQFYDENHIQPIVDKVLIDNKKNDHIKNDNWMRSKSYNESNKEYVQNNIRNNSPKSKYSTNESIEKYLVTLVQSNLKIQETMECIVKQNELILQKLNGNIKSNDTHSMSNKESIVNDIKSVEENRQDN